jgi:hypothetical protein
MFVHCSEEQKGDWTPALHCILFMFCVGYTNDYRAHLSEFHSSSPSLDKTPLVHPNMLAVMHITKYRTKDLELSNSAGNTWNYGKHMKHFTKVKQHDRNTK